MSENTKEVIDNLKEKAKEMVDTLNEILADITTLEEDYSELEYKVRDLEDRLDLEEEKDDRLDILSDIIAKAENWDVGLRGWRTLETKQDLIDAIKKEVL